jgi:DNA modification methylase
MSARILVGDAREQLKTLPDSSVHCAITSPPYFGLRNYGHPNQIGLEQSPDLYVAALVEVFREARRVLRPDGTLWVVIGDCFANDAKWGGSTGGKHVSALHGDTNIGRGKRFTGLKPKDLIGIPWLLAFALRADGWFLRSEVIWHKPACMPESVTDRPTRAHEQVFLFSKQARYYFDADAVREANQSRPQRYFGTGRAKNYAAENAASGNGLHDHARYDGIVQGNPAGRNIRSVWTVSPEPFTARKFPGYDGDADHYAAFPCALVEPMVKASTSERGCCGSKIKKLRIRPDLRPEEFERVMRFLQQKGWA